jgi:hypothetical protein
MGWYRCYFLDDRGKIVSVENIDAPDDEHAKRVATEMLAQRADRYPAIELWQLGRRVLRYPGEDDG